MAERKTPGASHVTHARDLFVEGIARSGLPQGLDPGEAARGVVCTLTRRLHADDASTLLDGLPVAIRELVTCDQHREQDEAEPWTRGELLGRIAEHVGADAREAERIARAVFVALQRHVQPDAVAAVGDALPSDIEELWRHPEAGLEERTR